MLEKKNGATEITADRQGQATIVDFNISICHEPDHASCAPHITPAPVSSKATNENHLRTGMVAVWPNRSLKAVAPLQEGSRCGSSMVSVTKRPSALQPERKR